MWNNVYLSKRFFWGIGCSVLLYVTAFVWPMLLLVAPFFLLFLCFATLLDVFLLFQTKKMLHVERKVAEISDLGEENEVELWLKNTSNSTWKFEVIEAFPVQLQRRNVRFSCTLKPGNTENLRYTFRPKQRGDYAFGAPWVFVLSQLGLARRRMRFPIEQRTKVFPSIRQMKRYEQLVIKQHNLQQGIKKIRRIGNNNEFEQIKHYVQGDEVRKVNWKATGKRNELMVNQYQEERSQPIYAIIDKSRNMQLMDEGMTVLDFAINSTLSFANIVLKKGDRFGMLTFSDKMGQFIPANRKHGQLTRIMDALYHQKTSFSEANYELLYEIIRRQVKTRSLLMLYTNFESEFALQRALPTLKNINKYHALVLVFFSNQHIEQMAFKVPISSDDAYANSVAENLYNTKVVLLKLLRENGIQAILTRPEELSLQSINKYLELKSLGRI